jgi:HSP20 family molecular chaperone IbpA
MFTLRAQQEDNMVFDDFIAAYVTELNAMFDSPEYQAKIPTEDLRLETELPGIKRDQVSVKFNGAYLVVEYTDRKKQKNSLRRYVPGTHFEQDATTCKLEDGLLSITVPLKKNVNGSKVISVDIK